MNQFTKKEKKLQSIQRSAYELFIDKGIDSTTIDDIVKKAGVAKGTFYLYFKDKKDLVEEIVLKKTTQILNEAMAFAENQSQGGKLSVSDRAILVVDYIIDFFSENKEFLSMIYKNLSMGLYHMADLTEKPVISHIAKGFMEEVGGDPKKAERKLYMIIELVGALCYNSILLNIPCSISEIKPDLFEVIRKMLD